MDYETATAITVHHENMKPAVQTVGWGDRYTGGPDIRVVSAGRQPMVEGVLS